MFKKLDTQFIASKFLVFPREWTSRSFGMSLPLVSISIWNQMKMWPRPGDSNLLHDLFCSIKYATASLLPPAAGFGATLIWIISINYSQNTLTDDAFFGWGYNLNLS